MNKLFFSIVALFMTVAIFAQDDVLAPTEETTTTETATTETITTPAPQDSVKPSTPAKPVVPKAKPINTQMYGKKLAEYVCKKLMIKEKEQPRVSGMTTAMMNRFKSMKKYSTANDYDLVMEKVEPVVASFEKQMEPGLNKKKKEILKQIGVDIRNAIGEQVRLDGGNFKPENVIKKVGNGFSQSE